MLISISNSIYHVGKIKNEDNDPYKFNIRLLNLFKEEVWNSRYILYKFESL